MQPSTSPGTDGMGGTAPGDPAGVTDMLPTSPPAPAAQGSAPGTFSSLLQPQGLCQALSGSAAHSRAAPWNQILFTLAKLDPDLLLPLKQTKKPHRKVPNSHSLFLWPSPLKMRGFRGETDPSGHLMEQVCDRLCPPCGPSRAPSPAPRG